MREALQLRGQPRGEPRRLPGLSLGRIFGVEIHLDWSLAVIFLIILFGLAMSWFPRWHADWSTATIWLASLAAAGLFFVSVLLHELSHAVVARRNGIPVKRITLFMLGGIAHMEDEPPTAGAEFKMAAIGPLVSIGLGFAAWFAAQALSAPLDEPADPAVFFSRLGPLASVLAWLGIINLILGVFNLIPGFPLDGGRVLRAGLWRATGDREKATRWASNVGRAFAGLLIAYGIVSVLVTGIVAGLWWVLVGWFLYGAARGSYEQVVIQQALADVPVRQVMRPRPETVPSDLPISTLVQEHIMAGDQHTFPVVQDGGVLVGMVSLEDVRKVSRDKWDRVLVAEVMTPAERLSTLSPDDLAADAFRQIATQDVGQIPVLEGGHLAGVLRREDLMKWMALYRPQRA